LESDHTHFVLFTADFTQQWQGWIGRDE
jgi:hypothetical protein